LVNGEGSKTKGEGKNNEKKSKGIKAEKCLEEKWTLGLMAQI
jgi:hypothetical protein